MVPPAREVLPETLAVTVVMGLMGCLALQVGKALTANRDPWVKMASRVLQGPRAPAARRAQRANKVSKGSKGRKATRARRARRVSPVTGDIRV